MWHRKASARPDCLKTDASQVFLTVQKKLAKLDSEEQLEI
jgi:hypothetical protein